MTQLGLENTPVGYLGWGGLGMVVMLIGLPLSMLAERFFLKWRSPHPPTLISWHVAIDNILPMYQLLYGSFFSSIPYSLTPFYLPTLLQF